MGVSNVGLVWCTRWDTGWGAFYDTAHEVANAVLVPPVMRFNAESTGERCRKIARAMGAVGIDAMSIDAARRGGPPCRFSGGAAGLSVPTSLRATGASNKDIPSLAAVALVDVCAGGNPREARLEDVVALYTAAF